MLGVKCCFEDCKVSQHNHALHMGSQVRLQSPQPITRKTVDYRLLAEQALRARFIRLVCLLLVAAHLVAVGFESIACSSLVLFPLSSISLVCAALVTVLMRKALIVTEPWLSLSIFREILMKLFSRRAGALVAGYWLSAYLYFATQFPRLANMSKYIKLSSPVPRVPAGLPRELFEENYGVKYLLNQHYTYGITLMAVLVFVYADYHLISNKDLLPSKPTGAPSPRPSFTLKCFTSAYVAFLMSFTTGIVWPIGYFVFGRILWPWVQRLLRIEQRTEFPGWTFLFCSTIIWLPLVFVWELSNQLFVLYMARGPIFHGHLISSASSDPNGSLISGLRCREGSLARLLAWQELDAIAGYFPSRRRKLFEDSDAERVVWREIYFEYRRLIADVMRRLEPPPQLVKSQKLQHNALIGLTGAKITSRKRRVYREPDLPRSARLLAYVQDLTDAGSWAADDMWIIFVDYRARTLEYLIQRKKDIMKMPWASPFRITFDRSMRKLFSDAALAQIAIHAISELVLCSWSEDSKGFVQNNIKEILTDLDKLLFAIEKKLNSCTDSNTDFFVVSSDPKQMLGALWVVYDEARVSFTKIVGRFHSCLETLDVEQQVLERAQTLS